VGLTQSRTLPHIVVAGRPQSAYPKQLTDPATYGGVYSGIPPDRQCCSAAPGVAIGRVPEDASAAVTAKSRKARPHRRPVTLIGKAE